MEAPRPDIAIAISQHLGDKTLTDEQVRNVLDAWNAIKEGDPVGMIRRDEETGAVAHRVDADGVHLWRISTPNGEQHNDLQPTLPWPVLYEPEA